MIGIVPAAGYATRLGTSLGSSKEMLDVGGAPVIESLVRRLEVGGCEEIRVVTRPEKRDLRTYAERRGLAVVLARPAHIGESIAAGLEGSGQDELVGLGFPDSLWEPVDGFLQLRGAVDGQFDVALGLFTFDDPARADVVVTDDAGRVHDILVKPPRPPSSLIWGCLVARRSVLEGIERAEWPSEHLRPLIETGRVRGCFLSDRYLDIGTPEALAQARQSPGAGR